MSLYTVAEIFVWLLLAAILGFILGWLIRGLRRSKPQVAASASDRVRLIAERTARGRTLPHDDLERIHGVGPQIAGLLKSMGIVSFQQVAEFTKADIATVSEALETFPDRIERDNWMGSARALHKEVHGSK